MIETDIIRIVTYIYILFIILSAYTIVRHRVARFRNNC